MKSITFGEFRKFCSQIDRVQISFLESGQYDNYRCISHVPESCNSFFLFGAGLTEGEFIDEDYSGWDKTGSAFPTSAARKDNCWSFKTCLEIVLSESPRQEHTDDR